MSTNQTLRVRLHAIRYGARNINIYHMAASGGGILPPVDPGAHIDLVINGGFTRQYSLINSGDALAEYVIAVQKDELGRGGSRAFHHQSVVGEEYEISTPRNNFPLANRAGPTYLFAGGIGVTPLVNMYTTLKDGGHPVTLYYWARTAADFLFGDELSSDGNVHLIPTDPDPSQVLLLGDVIPALPTHAHLYCCGPAGMLAAFDTACAGRNPDLVHQERFVANVPIAGANSFSVTLARQDKRVHVSPGETILQACLKAGVDVAYSCEEGLCGACEVRVLAGSVTHNDSVRTATEHDAARTMMICCSRAVGGDLTIDV